MTYAREQEKQKKKTIYLKCYAILIDKFYEINRWEIISYLDLYDY